LAPGRLGSQFVDAIDALPEEFDVVASKLFMGNRLSEDRP
jgi:hypothetical protein